MTRETTTPDDPDDLPSNLLGAERNLTFFGLAKKARSDDEEAREETLLTAVLAWGLERSPTLLFDLLARGLSAEFLERTMLHGSHAPSIRVEEPIQFEGARYRLDLVIDWPEFLVVIESKVVPDELNAGQLETYHRALAVERRSHALICVSPDTYKDFLRVRSSVNTAQDRTFHLTWGDVYDSASKLLDRTPESVDGVVGYEVTEAIAMAPGLKPFTGFDKEIVSAMRKMKETDRRIGELFTSLKGILTAPPPRGSGLEFVATHAEKPLAFRIPSSYWDEYYDEGLKLPDHAPPSTVIMGPWLRFTGTEGRYTVYTETTGLQSARPLHGLLRVRGGDFLGGVQKSFATRFPAARLTIKDDESQVGLYADIALTDPVLTAPPESGESPLVSATAAIIEFLRDEVLKLLTS